MTGIAQGSGRRRALDIVVGGVETADEFVEVQGGFPDFKKEDTARAVTADTAKTIDRRIVSFVFGAAAVELASSNLQRDTGRNLRLLYGGC